MRKTAKFCDFLPQNRHSRPNPPNPLARFKFPPSPEKRPQNTQKSPIAHLKRHFPGLFLAFKPNFARILKISLMPSFLKKARKRSVKIEYPKKRSVLL